MRRREFIAAIVAVRRRWPAGAPGAQQRALPIIGWLNSGKRDEAFLRHFLLGLSEVDLVDGRNVTIEYRWSENQDDRLPALAADLVRHHPAVIAVAAGGILLTPREPQARQFLLFF